MLRKVQDGSLRPSIAAVYTATPGSSSNSTTKTLISKFEEFEDIVASSSWWHIYMVVFEAVPMLLLQGYILFLTRDVTFLNVLSVSTNVLSIAWSMVGMYSNPQIGFTWWSILPTPISAKLIFFYLFYVGNVGMRIFPVIGLAMCNLLDEEAYEEACSQPVYFWLASTVCPLCGFAAVNFIAVGPGLARAGWKWAHREACTLVNVVWRLCESWVVALLVICYVRGAIPLAHVPGCEGLASYASCDGCCRGPVYLTEVTVLTVCSTVLYVVGFAVWWPQQCEYFRASPQPWSMTRPNPVQTVQLPRLGHFRLVQSLRSLRTQSDCFFMVASTSSPTSTAASDETVALA